MQNAVRRTRAAGHMDKLLFPGIRAPEEDAVA